MRTDPILRQESGPLQDLPQPGSRAASGRPELHIYSRILRWNRPRSSLLSESRGSFKRNMAKRGSRMCRIPLEGGSRMCRIPLEGGSEKPGPPVGGKPGPPVGGKSGPAGDVHGPAGDVPGVQGGVVYPGWWWCTRAQVLLPAVHLAPRYTTVHHSTTVSVMHAGSADDGVQGGVLGASLLLSLGSLVLEYYPAQSGHPSSRIRARKNAARRTDSG